MLVMHAMFQSTTRDARTRTHADWPKHRQNYQHHQQMARAATTPNSTPSTPKLRRKSAMSRETHGKDKIAGGFVPTRMCQTNGVLRPHRADARRRDPWMRSV